jgi:hypothetical protein
LLSLLLLPTAGECTGTLGTLGTLGPWVGKRRASVPTVGKCTGTLGTLGTLGHWVGKCWLATGLTNITRHREGLEGDEKYQSLVLFLCF